MRLYHHDCVWANKAEHGQLRSDMTYHGILCSGMIEYIQVCSSMARYSPIYDIRYTRYDYVSSISNMAEYVLV